MANYQSNSRVRFFGPNNQARAVFIPARDENGNLQRRYGKAAQVSPDDLKLVLDRASSPARREVEEFLSKKRTSLSTMVRTELAGLFRGYFGVDSMLPAISN